MFTLSAQEMSKKDFLDNLNYSETLLFFNCRLFQHTSQTFLTQKDRDPNSIKKMRLHFKVPKCPQTRSFKSLVTSFEQQHSRFSQIQ